jgi:alpha-beta hydrolase superfamily lysophospholipase
MNFPRLVPASAVPLIFLGLLVLSLGGCAASAPENDAGNPGKTALESGQGPDAGLATPATRLSGDRYIATDGTVLPLRSWLPQGKPDAVILALHGFNDYSNAFALPAPGLVAHGVAVYAYDQRGFGAGPHHGYWSSAETMAADATDAATLLHRLYPDRPLYILGESMGGAVAILAATRADPPPIDGVILSAPAVWGRQTMNLFERSALWIARLMPSVHFSGRELPIKVKPSDNIPMLIALGADPLVIKETRSDAINGLVDLMSEALEAGPALQMKTLMLYGEHDEIVPREPVERLIESLPATARQRVALYDKGYHMLLRDLDADVVIGDIAAWLHDSAAALPSGADHAARTILAGKGPAASIE